MEDVAENDILWAADVNRMAGIGGASGLVYGERFKTLEKARKFASASGCDPDKMIFVNQFKDDGTMKTSDEILEEIRGGLPEGYKDVMINRVGLRAAEGKFGAPKNGGKLLEVRKITIGRQEALLTMNTGKALFRIVKSTREDGMVALQDIGITGLTCDETGVVFRLPLIIPGDIVEELEKYRTAILILSAAA